MNKQLIIVSSMIVLSVSMLIACSKHINPLLAKNKVEAAKFIEQASQYAVEKGKFHGFRNSDNYYKCYHNIAALDNPFNKTSTHQCTRFFNLMVSYAKTTKQFSSVTVNDLKDANVMPRLSQYIQEFDDHNTSKQEMTEEEKVLLKQEK